jgi:HTH-type transcriptional regulator / antitoxin HigA
MLSRIKTEKEYNATMKTIESLLDKATKKGGFHLLEKEEAALLANLSKLAEAYEDTEKALMPIHPKNLQQAVAFKMVQQNMTQAALAKKLGIRAPKLSQILSGKRNPDIEFLKALHKKLNIDADFLLMHA